MARHRRGVVLFTAAVALTLLATACGGGDQTVEVTLLEWGIGLTDRSANAGEVTFEATNDGPNDVHEFVILRTDLAATELPTDETGAVDEVGEGIEVIDEIEDIPVGETQTLTVDLESGNYVVICNIYDEDKQESHYQEGMRTSFTVE
jgi:uncharacterized cupredoxin-like copper-binding protein